MKKLVCAFVLPALLVGCSTDIQSAVKNEGKSRAVHTEKKPDVIPEPLTNALISLKNDDLDHGIQYINLTNSDFKSSPYIIDSHVLSNLVLWSKIKANLDLSGYLGQGIGHKNAAVLYNHTDLNNLDYIVSSTQNIVGSDLDKISSSVSETYALYKSIKSNEPIQVIYNPTVLIPNDLSFFGNVGYPVPSQSEVKLFLENDQKQELSFGIGTVFKDGKISYVDYFAIMSSLLKNDDPVKKQILLEVMEITKNDKYNQARLDAEKMIEQIEGTSSNSSTSTDGDTSAPADTAKVTIQGTPKKGGWVALDVSGIPDGYTLKTLEINKGAKLEFISLEDAEKNGRSLDYTGFSISPDGRVISYKFDKTKSDNKCQFIISYMNSNGGSIQAKSDSFDVH